jgi:hypothetical protein
MNGLLYQQKNATNEITATNALITTDDVSDLHHGGAEAFERE